MLQASGRERPAWQRTADVPIQMHKRPQEKNLKHVRGLLPACSPRTDIASLEEWNPQPSARVASRIVKRRPQMRRVCWLAVLALVSGTTLAAAQVPEHGKQGGGRGAPAAGPRPAPQRASPPAPRAAPPHATAPQRPAARAPQAPPAAATRTNEAAARRAAEQQRAAEQRRAAGQRAVQQQQQRRGVEQQRANERRQAAEKQRAVERQAAEQRRTAEQQRANERKQQADNSAPRTDRQPNVNVAKSESGRRSKTGRQNAPTRRCVPGPTSQSPQGTNSCGKSGQSCPRISALACANLSRSIAIGLRACSSHGASGPAFREV